MARTDCTALLQLIGKISPPHSANWDPLTQLGKSSVSKDIFVAATLLFTDGVAVTKEPPTAAGMLSKKKIILAMSKRELSGFSVR